MHERAEKLRELFRGEKRVRLIVALGLCGMGLILLSGLLSPHEEKAPAEPVAAQSADTPEVYRAELEERLTALLSHMEGVGEVSVMITLSGSAEQVYAEEVKASKSENSAQTESSPVLTRSGSSESALITETKYPPVLGAAILCSGGGHAAVRERVIQAASALLGLPAGDIYVGKAAGS